ncbi:redoxin family protein [Gracilimonas sp.]|uniref:peroxiredoxin family protein n=1 Tax=Gracilimonas sp. TaxID=1974203 RepID=UPI003BAB043B
MKKLLLLPFAILFTASVLAQVNTGEEAPGFTYTSLENEEVSLSDFDGKVVYIFFYGAGCPHCLDNGPITEEDIYQPFMDDTNFVALGLDTWNLSVSANQSFRSETGISYTLLLNARQSLEDYYGNTSSYDRSVVISKEGNVVYKGTGFVDTDTDQVIAVIEEELSKTITSAEPVDEFPDRISLAQNYPNPFNPSTTISYSLNKPSQVSLKIYNMLGAEIATLVNERQPAGEKTVSWNALSSSGSTLPSGLYIYQLKTGKQVLTKKMMLIK